MVESRRFTGRLRRPSAGRLLVRLGVVAGSGALVLSMTACGSSPAPSDQSLTFGLSADSAPNGFDPLLYSNGQSTFFSGLYNSLFVTGPNGDAEPSLVSSFTNGDGGRQLTLTLRSGVTFTDGSKLTSTLVKDNLDRRDDAKLAAYGSLAKGGAAAISSIETPNSRTVVIDWATPQASGQNNLVDETGMIVGAKAIADPGTLRTTPDGSGPYTLSASKTTAGSTYTFEKNAKAWDAKDYAYDSIVFKIIVNSQTLANAVVSGQVDVAGQLDNSTVSLVDAKQKTVKDGGTIVGFPVADKLGVTSKPFGNVKVRQALMYAIDRDSIVKELHPGDKPTAQIAPSGAPGYDAALNRSYAYDPAKAKQLLAAAGYPDGFSFTMVVLGQPTEDEVAVQKQWAQVGVTMNFKIVASTDAAFAAVTTTPLLFNQVAVGDQIDSFVAGQLYGGYMNLQKATDTAISQPLATALASTGSARTAALSRLNAAVANDVWFIPVYEEYVYFGYNASKVDAPVFSGTNGYLLLSDLKPAA